MIVRRVFGILRVQLSEMLNFQVPKQLGRIPRDCQKTLAR
jgi:hypothetical protein